MGKGLIRSAILIVVIVLGIGSYYFITDIRSEMAHKKLVKNYEKPIPEKTINEDYDVIVIGGEPEGVAAAVSAARNGAKTLLVEKREELGGLFTYGMLNFLDIPRNDAKRPVSMGIFKEWHDLVRGKDAFGIIDAKAAFKKLVDEEPNLTLSVQTEVVNANLDSNQLASVELKNKYGTYTVKGKTFIDATQDADFATMSKVPFFMGGEDIGIKDKRMAVTLMLHLKNVDWDKVKKEANSNTFGGAHLNDSVMWGFTKLHDDYKPVQEGTRLRGLNLAKVDDEYYINALQIFGIDGLNELSKQEAIEKGKKETEHILKYLHEKFPGFENVEVVSYPEELYVRETRHIWAEYQLPMSDVWKNSDHWDSIGVAAYPVDVQAQTPHDYGYVISAPNQYAIPFRSLVPKEIDGLLVVGRSAGYSSLAAGSARVVPTGMVTGEAAGAAAALATKEDVTFRAMSKDKKLINTLREDLKKQGAFVDPFEMDYPYKDEWYDKSIQTLINYGLVVGGYSNDLNVEDTATKIKFAKMLKEGVQRVSPEKMNELKDKLDVVIYKVAKKEKSPIKRDEVAQFLAEVLVGKSSDNNWNVLIEKGIISEKLAKRLTENKELKLKELYAIMADVIHYAEKEHSH
ncbi:glucose-inhibited division protein A [Lysinibacillus sphaericus]|uniref:FAD-dependent oxidoreductase n=1 Tax=Lysinibacillus sphaericus TaxID=1421 RepID=UPI0018CCD377|nr:FAD-dependent oxidoreductase [Lysinibacillus sphaericus]MBG9453699.1 glucose-inhibited division protein A [Lysinibacillus sphaericus]MBG9476170.1 glucose-inhibited division protein A [Lysinibacillus sphaericus]MBG9591584.1 glucose-inhibited division protein A [Lysinibacillus sphaericus]